MDKDVEKIRRGLYRKDEGVDEERLKEKNKKILKLIEETKKINKDIITKPVNI